MESRTGVFRRAQDLEAFLGDPLRPDGVLTYAQAVADDQQERFPHAALDALHSWGYTAYQVPERSGGRLTSLEELSALGRVIASRDPAVAVIANSPLAAAMPVWLAGTPSQREEVARAVLDGQRVALGLTEREHGADLLASEVTGRLTDPGYLVNGTKWLINNVRLARYLCLLVRDPERTGLRSLSLLLVDMQRLDPSSYELLPRIPTHGIRGADIAGVRFRDAVVPASACIGGPGRGLEITARSLLVTRTLVPSLSLGALDTALRCNVHFLRDRRLYGGPAVDIPFVRDELAAALLDLSVGEVVTRCCLRVLHLLPELAAVSSAVAKYLVPHVTDARMRRLGMVLGARSFLGEDHWSGIFDKLLRDTRLFGLFDGSEPVVLSALAAQASCLTAADTDPRRSDCLFRSDGEQLAARPFDTLDLDTVADQDPVTTGLDEVCAALARAATGTGTDQGGDLLAAAELLRAQGAELREQAEQAVDPRSEAGQRLGERYARLFASVCLARTWLDVGPGGVFPSGATTPTARGGSVPAPWVAAGLIALLRPGQRMPRTTSRTLFRELMRQCADRTTALSMFSVHGER